MYITMNAEFERIGDLLRTIQEKDARIIVLENKVAALNNMLAVTIKDAPRPPRRNKKYLFYQEHKNDDFVLEQVELFKKTFPTIKKPPWQFIKAMTDLQCH